RIRASYCAASQLAGSNRPPLFGVEARKLDQARAGKNPVITSLTLFVQNALHDRVVWQAKPIAFAGYGVAIFIDEPDFNPGARVVARLDHLLAGGFFRHFVHLTFANREHVGRIW